MRAVLTQAATIGAVREVGANRTRYQVSTGLARYFAVAQKKTWKIDTAEMDRKDLANVIGVALAPHPGVQANASIVLNELHPISDAAGYAAEVYPLRIEDTQLQQLIKKVLGAGATVPGVGQRANMVNATSLGS